MNNNISIKYSFRGFSECPLESQQQALTCNPCVVWAVFTTFGFS